MQIRIVIALYCHKSKEFVNVFQHTSIEMFDDAKDTLMDGTGSVLCKEANQFHNLEK